MPCTRRDERRSGRTRGHEFLTYRKDLSESGRMTRDTACSLSNSFPGFRCIGMLPRIYWRETVWFRATHRSLAIGRATLLAWHVWALKYVSESIPKCSRSSTACRVSHWKFWISLRSSSPGTPLVPSTYICRVSCCAVTGSILFAATGII